jgi:hypothetical protein
MATQHVIVRAMLRHLTLFLFLIGLSLSSVTAPVQAASDAPVVASCHDAMPAPHHKQDGDSGTAAKHQCIGCVANSAPPAAPEPLSCPAMAPTTPAATIPAEGEAESTTPPPRP